MKRKIFAMLLVFLLCVSLCACGSYRANDKAKDKGTVHEKTDMMPDAEDGYIDDDTGSGGIISGDLTIPSPNVSHSP